LICGRGGQQAFGDDLLSRHKIVLIPSAAHAKMFSGKYSHRTMTGGIGHNRPEEAPQAFAEPVVDVTADS
jgi:hypothetical protein